jgi:DNA invertase Pin-like site-specific DNA recombinase
MITDKIKKLADYQGKVADLQKTIEKERAKALAHLHEEYGYESANELIKAIRKAAGSGGKRRGRPGKRHRKHARITPEMKAKIKTAIEAGKPGSRIAEEFGISLPSVYNIKKAFGLVKARKKK